MFNYSDPTRTGVLASLGALPAYQATLANMYFKFSSLKKSAFTSLEAFEALSAGKITHKTITWSGFPVTAAATPQEIDDNRLVHQDEYVEWRVERVGGQLNKVVFTTEFPEYFMALAEVSSAALKTEINNLFPAANPSDQDLFGVASADSLTPTSRGQAFLSHLAQNPWNTTRGILCLTQQFNTMGALFGLLGACGILKPNVQPGAVCGLVGGACGPGRNSDPSVCENAQIVARSARSFSLVDPGSIKILELDPTAEWKVDGTVVDINDETANKGAWKVSRNGLRATFSFGHEIKVNGQLITTGAQLSHSLKVGTTVLHALNADLPAWARPGNENQVRLHV